MLPQERIIVPLDVPDLESAIELTKTLPDVTFWKVGLELFVSAGTSILDYLKEQEKRIFLDLKFHDIPNTIEGACRSAMKYNVDLLTVHATAGKEALKAAVKAKKESNSSTKLVAITLLTSINTRELALDLKIPLELPEYTLQMAILAQDSGLDGVVCSPQEVGEIRRVCGENFWLVCPGVRPTFSQKGDQKRVMTPKEALQSGADYLVIGRPITQSETPEIAWQQICQEIAQ
ncbi:orotidine-5'-phosphate decarboxylase [Dactylococcopsis salina]|uniref:Orotidine 5'-phosphate decarboxylase n=1 Tax=Dactylococcopsis salina (strain PCC 8305) TaxID=13035 RepID=K9YW07_DACS8|nr:orotidine-5'-phosphate decarboxylase [Dactylococcopsis salina]AFZ51116.1 orotidine 5''-phosphate decarboxylase, subfamily 1 [Dactylococcopsis salina PCC 8305]